MTDKDPMEGLEPFTVTDEDGWRKTVEINSEDGYSRGVITYCARWANLIESEIQRRELVCGEDATEDEKQAWQDGSRTVIEELADTFADDADTEGITGFMYGMAVSILVQVWLYGPFLKRWHNKQYGQENAEGVVNPAIISIGKD